MSREPCGRLRSVDRGLGIEEVVDWRQVCDLLVRVGLTHSYVCGLTHPVHNQASEVVK